MERLAWFRRVRPRLGTGVLVLIASAITFVHPAIAQYRLPQIARQPEGLDLYGPRIAELLLACALGFAVGAFFSPLLKPVRKIIWIVAAVAAVGFTLFGPAPAADTLGWIVKGISFWVALFFGLRLGAKALRKAAAKRKRATSFGSAKWATADYLAEAGLFKKAGYMLGEFPSGGKLSRLHYDGARHLLTVAPTRSGKGVSSIIPNLLLHDGSALVVDPKGENALITATRRGGGDIGENIKGMGQKIILLDPWDVAASKLGLTASRFNPLDWIKADDPDAAENAFLLADALVIKEGSGGDSLFWDEEAKALLMGIILYVATAPEEEGKRNLGRVRDILNLDDDGLRTALIGMYRHPHPMVIATAARTASKDVKLRGGVFASAQSHTHFLDSPRIRESLSVSDFRFEDLKSEKVTVYLILPADRLSTFNRWLRLLIQQAITVNARNISEKPAKPILFLLDEMPTLGKLPSVEQAYGLMAGFGMQLWGIVQDLSQLAKIYGEHGWQTFVSNSGVIQYFGSRDKMTAEYFSALCGVTTIEVHNFQWAVGKAVAFATNSSTTSSPGGGSSTYGTSTTTTDNWTRTTGTSEAQRHLAYPDELMVLKGNQQIIFVENFDPILAEKVLWYRDGDLRAHGVNLHQSTSPPPDLPPKPLPIERTDILVPAPVALQPRISPKGSPISSEPESVEPEEAKPIEKPINGPAHKGITYTVGMPYPPIEKPKT